MSTRDREREAEDRELERAATRFAFLERRRNVELGRVVTLLRERGLPAEDLEGFLYEGALPEDAA